MATCWVSNPFTQVAIWLSQEKLGDWVRSQTQLNVPNFLDVERTVLNATLNLGSFTVGFLVMGVILSILAYPIVYGIYAFLPSSQKGKPTNKRANSK